MTGAVLNVVGLAMALLAATPLLLKGQTPGHVYLVLGSDTAIWEGMDTSRFHCHYNIRLYTNQAMNAYKVMDPAFRSRFVDSYGQTVKLTWWMMAGQIFRYADNTDVPVPNTMTLHLMKKHHGAAIQQFGDELSLHYHTFAWTNYTGGAPFWAQAKTFMECKDDFEFTIAQFLLEEGIFPVSFRTGWEWKDTPWQNHLDRLLPFSMEAYWRTDWLPFHPATNNFRVPGNGKGWNVKSVYMANISQAQMNAMFAQAAAGTDQVACIWAHLPETDFLTNIANVNAKAQLSASNYPGVKFRYCTAVEAMQRWLKATNETAPQLEVVEETDGGTFALRIHSDKPIFQPQPFVAVKDIYKQTSVLPCVTVEFNTWKVVMPLSRRGISDIGLAATDQSGHLATRLLHYADIPEPPLPPARTELVIDTVDAAVVGSWITGVTSTDKFGSDYRYKAAGDGSAYLRYTPALTNAGNYQVFEWHPQGSNRTTNATYVVQYNGGQQTIHINQKIDGGRWNLLGTFNFAAGTNGFVQITDSFPDTTQYVLADAIKFVDYSAGDPPPVILSQPLDCTVDYGERATFFVLAAGGAEPMSYQWRLNDKEIAGATATSYIIETTRAEDAGNYQVVILNGNGRTISSNAVLVVHPPVAPSITVQPQSQSASRGATVVFSAAVSGTKPFSYAWFFNSAPLIGAADESLTISNVTTSNVGSYNVLVTNPGGAVLSSNAMLALAPPISPRIVKDPAGQAVAAGTTFELNTEVSGSPPFSYQWRWNGAAVPGATISSLVFSSVQLEHAGSYDVIVFNDAGSVTSATAVVTVLLSSPSRFVLPSGGEGSFQIDWRGSAPYRFVVEVTTNFTQWAPLATTEYGSNSLLFSDSDSVIFPCRFYRSRSISTSLLTDFETNSPGSGVMFRSPMSSGSSSAFVDGTVRNFTWVTNSFPPGHAGTRVLQSSWAFKNGVANPWMRLTATDGPVIPNPTVDFRQGLQFDLFSDQEIYIVVGLRETDATAAIGGNGGSSGSIEWVGGISDNNSSPSKGRLIPANRWTTLRFFFAHEPIKSFSNGDGALTSTSGKGVFEHIAIVPATSATAYNLFLDNFEVIHVAR